MTIVGVLWALEASIIGTISSRVAHKKKIDNMLPSYLVIIFALLAIQTVAFGLLDASGKILILSASIAVFAILLSGTLLKPPRRFRKREVIRIVGTSCVLAAVGLSCGYIWNAFMPSIR